MGCEIYPNWTNYKIFYNYQLVTTTSKETGKLLDSKTKNTLLKAWYTYLYHWQYEYNHTHNRTA